MPGVSTYLAIQDRMTSVLNRQRNASERLAGSMRRVETLTNTISSPAAPLDGGIQKAVTGMRSFASEQEQAIRGTERLGGAWGGVGRAIRFAAIAAAGMKAIKLTFGAGMSIDTLHKELQARLGDDAIGSAMFSKLYDQSKSSAFGMKELAANTLSFMSMTTNPKNLDGLNNLAEKLAIFDKTGQGLEGAGFSLKEALSGDIVSLAERFNMSKSQIRALGIDELGKAGDVEGFIRQFNKLLDMQNMGEEAYKKMLQAPEKQLAMFLSNMQNGFAMASQSALEALAPLFTRMNEWFASDQASVFFERVAQGMQLAVFGALWLVDAVGWVTTAVQNNWDILEPILAALATIYLVRIIYLLGAQAAAWLASAWPILLIGALLAGLLIWMDKVGIGVDMLTGVIGAALGWVFGVLYNGVADIWNLLAVFGEFFANFLDDPIGSVVRLFVGFVDTVLGLLETVADGIDAIFGTSMADTLTKWRADLQAMTDETFGKGKIQIERMEKVSSGDWAKEGFLLGNALPGMIGDGISGVLDGFGVPGFDSSALDGFEGITNIAKVGEVGKIGSDVNIAKEDLELLRDVAEHRFISYYKSLTPNVTVTMSSENGDNSPEAVAREIERVLVEQAYASAEEVHA